MSRSLTHVLMPQLGESIAEGTIVRWMKQAGDAVGRDEPLFEISTDKVDAEIPSPASGVLADIRVPAGETVPIDSVVAVIAEAGASADGDGASADADGAGAGAEAAGVASAPGPASGDGAANAAASAAAASAAAASAAAAAGSEPAADSAGRERAVRHSPLVRRLAREHGISVDDLTGTGAGGRVTRDDVLRRAGALPPAAGAAAVGPEHEDGARVAPMSVMRRQIAEHMLRSRRTSAHVHTLFDVDLTCVERLRGEHREAWAAAGVRLTWLAFVARAASAALAAEPRLNAAISGDGRSIVHRRDVNLGIAVALDDGLIVPVIRRADRLTLAELSRAIADAAERARAGALAPDDVSGGTFTITNPGSFGSLLGLPIIHQPQVAILCVGAVERRPAVVDDEGTIAAQTRCYLTLGFDHRLIDGAVADRFMARVKADLESFDPALVALA